MTVRVMQVSDTHLSPHRAYAQHNWDRFLEFVEREQPDLVVHTGDVVLDSPDDAADRHYGRGQLDRLPVPWLAVPGNHDIGDTCPSPWMGEEVTPERMAAYLASFRFDCWIREYEPWTLVGLNAQLLGSGLDGEDRQWETLAEALDRSRDGYCALFMHKPVFAESPDEKGDRDSAILERARTWFRGLPPGAIRAVFSGHLHVYRMLTVGATSHVWAPTTALISAEELGHSAWGQLVNGCVDCRFLDDGSFRAQLVIPLGFKPVDYSNVPDDVPRGSRFLPPLPLNDALAGSSGEQLEA